MIRPPALQPGDTVAITATARKMPVEALQYAQEALAHWGYQVQVSETIGATHHIFAGSDQLRAQEFQGLLDDPEIKAIWCGRGGYGTIRMLEQLNWDGFLKHPKWIIGFSDVTNVLTKTTQLSHRALHGPMPITVGKNWREDTSLSQLFSVLKGEALSHEWSATANCKQGAAQGTLLGGNLANLCMLSIGLPKSYFDGAILFIEDIDEYLYQIDRMLRSMRYSGKLDGIKAVLVGQFSAMKDNEDPFGESLEQLVRANFQDLNIPVAFGFQAGHEKENWPLELGVSYALHFEQAWKLVPAHP